MVSAGLGGLVAVVWVSLGLGVLGGQFWGSSGFRVQNLFLQKGSQNPRVQP